MSEYKDNQLIQGLVNNDQDAFCSLYAKYRRKILHFILTFLKSEDIAEDICQDVFMIIWRNRNFLDPNASFQSYLYTIARNRVLNFIRDNAQKQLLDDIIMAEAIDIGADVFENITAKELERNIEQAIEKLTDRQREIFNLSRHKGLSHQEIAQMLHISVSTVNEHITNALKAIQNHLGKIYNVYIVFTIISLLNG